MKERTKVVLQRRIAGEEFQAIATSLGLRVQAVRMACYRAMWKGVVTAEQIRYAPTAGTLSDEAYDARWLERLASKSRPAANGCIEVPDVFHNEDGYAIAQHRKLGQFAHHVIVILKGRPIPPGFMSCHRCGNHACVNDDHLYVGTMKQNARDTVAMGRHLEANKTECISGHAFTPENTYIHNRKRKCLACLHIAHQKPSYIAWRREYQAKRRAERRARREAEAFTS